MATTATFRFLKFSGLILSCGLLLNACITPPDYPDTPSIEFKAIKLQRKSPVTGVYDSVTVTVSFKDGDGDLGLSPTDTLPPHNQYNPNSTDPNRTPNRFYNNYFFQPLLKGEDGVFRPIDFAFPYDSRFPRLTNSDRSEPIKGDLNFSQTFFRGAFPSGSEVRFEVSIVDRALHESNKVTTSSVIIP
ncbi:hypothetical protein [Hymenobacter sp. DG25A]|uniref:hypothetical protein n=1 Tax=Hymenobacter sp. DG25A TaxID=1385663 RepID=UPI0006BC4B66|nr:hypothetical protein [Hymenobacter sp. DG25A]ALD21217.1 hypothetical protein AM218_08305 [Hymenobacter sp. DG25A]